MSEKADQLKVEKIRTGTVIDHIPAGKAMDVYRHLKGIDNQSMIIAVNVPSTRMKKKDILKIENKKLAHKEYNYIALIAPEATIVTIKDYEVIKKEKPELPKTVEGIVRCDNPKCVTNTEDYITTSFTVVKKDPLKLKCAYCEHEQKI